LPTTGCRCFAYVGPCSCPRWAAVFSFSWSSAGDWLEDTCSVRRWSGLSGPSSGGLERWESVGVLGCGPWRGSSIAQTPGPTGTVRELLFGFCWSPPKNPSSMSMRGLLLDPAGFWTISPSYLVERLVERYILPSSGRRFNSLFCLRRAVVLPPLDRCLISFRWRLAVGDWMESCRSVRRWSGLSGPSSVLGRWESRCLWLWMGGSSIAQAPGPTGTVRELLFGYCWSPPKNPSSMSMRGLYGSCRRGWTISPFYLVERYILPSSGRRFRLFFCFVVLSHLNCVVVIPVIPVA